jgi:hypothetical protein
MTLLPSAPSIATMASRWFRRKTSRLAASGSLGARFIQRDHRQLNIERRTWRGLQVVQIGKLRALKHAVAYLSEFRLPCVGTAALPRRGSNFMSQMDCNGQVGATFEAELLGPARKFD